MLAHTLQRRSVLMLGYPYFASYVAALVRSQGWSAAYIDCTSSPNRWKRRAATAAAAAKALMSDIVYQIGGPLVPPQVVRTCRLRGVPIVLHWVGSDVTDLRLGDMAREQIAKANLVHWTDAPWLADELTASNVRAAVFAFCVAPQLVAPPMPSNTFTVLAYLPDEKFEFYGGPMVLWLAERMPEVRFLVVAGIGPSKRTAPANVHFQGWQSNMDAIYAQTHALLRITEHDGLPFMVIEALNRGRYVLFNHDVPGATLVHTKEAMLQQLSDLRRRHAEGTLRLNEAGMAYVRTNFAREAVSQRIVAALESEIERKSGKGPREA